MSNFLTLVDFKLLICQVGEKAHVNGISFWIQRRVPVVSSVGMLGSFVGFSGNRGAGGRGSFLLLKVKIQQVNG